MQRNKSKYQKRRKNWCVKKVRKCHLVYANPPPPPPKKNPYKSSKLWRRGKGRYDEKEIITP